MVQNDPPNANSVVNTMNKNKIRKFLHYLQTYISSAQQIFRVFLVDFEITWMIAEIRASFGLVQFFFLQIKVQFISYTIVS